MASATTRLATGTPDVAAVLHVQRSAGNHAVAAVLAQRDWTGDRTAEVKATMTGSDWNRPDGPWFLLNRHNPDALVGIMRRLGRSGRAQLAAHPPDPTKYDKERLDFALAHATAGGTAAELSGMDAIRNARSGAIKWADCWIILDKLGNPKRMALYRGMGKPELQELILHAHDADERRQGALEEEINQVIAPPVKDVLLDFVPDDSELPGPHGNLWPLGTITVLVKGAAVTAVPARGGPWISHPDRGNPGHTADPTTAGTFTLAAGKPIVTSAWVYSQIADGTPIRDTGTDVEYLQNSKWRSTRTLTKPLTRDDIMEPSAQTHLHRLWKRGNLTRKEMKKKLKEMRKANDFTPLVPTWILNDFGTQGFVIQGTPGDIIHTTEDTDDPEEMLKPGDLSFSHGCVHILASDRDKLIEQGFLRGGVKMKIHPYDPTKLSRWDPPPQ